MPKLIRSEFRLRRDAFVEWTGPGVCEGQEMVTPSSTTRRSTAMLRARPSRRKPERQASVWVERLEALLMSGR